ncbi:hypothetical protein ACGFIY_21510 [Micromonospora chersina]|uniref:hypothetical protein n=1 Tax=Micromonospora chersina TaxID=47854 RepID=UPI003711D466
MTEQTTNADTRREANTAQRTAERTPADVLRYVPPVAALGTAFVLQVIVITDTVGTSLAARTPNSEAWPWYLVAALLGVSVASCAEGGAAYLMDLYDRHLLARDSVWVLRLAMVGYVTGSALVIHWWTDHRGLPTVVSWLLAGMSASALFLWSRGSRWRNREAMRAAGQLDPAMPRLSMQAKLLHPVRWAITLWLVSWEPVETTDQARARYQQWKDSRAARRQSRKSGRPSEPKANTGQPSKPRPATQQTEIATSADALVAASAQQTPSTRVAANVRTIESARRVKRPNADTAEQERATIERLKLAFPQWRTVMPSVRDIGGLLDASNYTGQKYQRLLAAERANEQHAAHPAPSDTADPEDAADVRSLAHAH